jgi:signal transduction histidine kinase
MDQGSDFSRTAANHLVAFSRSLTRPLERKVLAALLSPIVVMLVAGVAFLGIQRMREAQSWVSHTREVNDLLRQTELALVEAGTEERAFLLSQSPRYLERYKAAAGQARTLLGQLVELVRDNPAESRRATEVRRQGETALAELSTALDAFQASGTVAARQNLLATDADRNTEMARRTIQEMIAAERALLVERTNRREHEIEFTNWVIAAGSLFAALLALAVNVAIRHDLTLQRKNQGLLEEQAARLESQRNTLEANERALARQLEAERSLSDRLAAASASAELALAERNTASAALERSNRELNQFAYVASHDLKAPLRGIANLAQWVEEDLGEAMTAAAREHIRVLLSRVRRMESLIDGILAYAKAGRAEGQREQIDVGQLVQEVRELLSPPSGMFTVTVAPNLPRVMAVRAPFQQVWMNLLGNAFKHARRAGAEIRIGAADRTTEWEFAIADNGPGIAPQYHQRVFGIFQTLAARDKLEGTGIGLATVKKLVETEGGRVWVDSQTGQGATFRFTWPKMQASS